MLRKIHKSRSSLPHFVNVPLKKIQNRLLMNEMRKRIENNGLNPLLDPQKLKWFVIKVTSF